MMSEYTKGPWHVARESWHTMDIKSEAGDYLGEVMTYICGESDDSEQDWDTINERKANAQLMASAPDLLEALIEVAASLEWNAHGICRAINDGPIMPSSMAVEFARKAIAKALTPQS